MAIDSNVLSPLQTSSLGAPTDTGLTDATQESMGREEFLKLLMAQLEQQDPMNPVENSEFVAQLATFSSLEQQITTNTRLEELQLTQLSASNAQLASFIGQEVSARGDEISIQGGTVEPIGYNLDANAQTVKMTISDAAGRVVKTIELASQSAGAHQAPWAGVDISGSPLPDGSYTVAIEATNAQGDPINASTVVTGTVTGLSFANGYPELLVGSLRLAPADIISVGGSTELPVPSPSTPQPSNAPIFPANAPLAGQ